MHRRFTAVLRWLFLIIILIGMFGQPRGTQLANAASLSDGSSSETRGSVYAKLNQAPASRTGVSSSAQNFTSLPGSEVVVLPATNSASSNDIGLNNSSERRNSNAGFVGVEPYVTPSFATYSFNGGLTIEPIAAYNLIVDSNVLSPSSYGPSAATLGAKFCNTNSTDLTNVWAYIGDFNADNDNTPGEAGDQTPGIYPVHNATTDASFNSTFPHLATPPTAVDYGDPSRFYALEHEAGSASDTADASRYIGTLAAGQCKTHYWLVSYPRKAMISGNWVDVTGGVKPEDDLWLAYYFWGTSGATSNNQSYLWNPVTMRNEISAMANKIWPNGDNKVPDQYITAIQQILGWDTWTPNGTGNTAYPGETVTSQGIWYDLGNVGAGFDNNLDFVPDRNLWVQPIGDADAYDPGCFRLVRSYGLVIVKLNDGTELLIPFVDQMYFENIPDNNNGAVGLVFYEYVALDGACTAGLTPYQEVASGYDNEKFNADFGAGIPRLQSRQSNMTLDKNGQTSIGLGGTINYTMTFTLPDADATAGNTMTVTVGSPSLGMPLTYYETVPSGLQYVGGSASANVTMTNYGTGTVSATRLWSTDSGATWTPTDPGTVTSISPNNLVIIQWQLDQGIVSPANGPNVTGQVSFSAAVPGGYTSTIVTNTSCLKLGNAECFTEDTHTTLVTGTGRIEGTVWKDDATGSGVLGNGILDETGAGIPAVTVNLYWDANGDGDHADTGDFFYTTITSDASGNYAFTNLPATSGSGLYLIEVNATDSDIPAGYGPSTRTIYTGISLASGGVYGDGAGEPSDFGFVPALSLDKQLTTTGAIYVGDTVNYTIYLNNNLPGDGTPGGAYCTYTLPAKSFITDTNDTPSGANSTNGRWQDPANLVNMPDGLYAFTIMSDNSDYVGLNGFNRVNLSNLGGSITSVQYKIYVREKAELKSTDELEVHTYYNNAVVDTDIHTGGAFFTSPAGSTYIATGDVTSARAWTFTDFQNNLSEMRLVGDKGGGAGSSGDIEVDAAVFVITTNQLCTSSSSSILNPVPLTDVFDNTRFSFISSDPAATSVSGNTIIWTNVGPIYPGGERAVRVTLRATAQGTNVPNTGTSTGSKFENGLPANTPVTDTVTVNIANSLSTGQISGFIWDDDNSNGWQATNGYEAGDTFISDVRVHLYVCKDAADNLIADTGNMSSCGSENGTWVIAASTFTISTGAYSFTGLRSGFYRVFVDDSTIVGFTSQTGDVNQKTGLCTACDDQSNTFDQDMDDAAFIGQINGSNSITNVNFGYVAPDGTSSTIGDTLFYDWDGDGVQDAIIDEGIPNITVRLYDLSGDLIGTPATTDVNGQYLFSNLPAGQYTVRVDLTDTEFPVSVSQTADPDQNGICTVCDSAGIGSVNGTPAGSDSSVDFGYQPTGSGMIGDTVWVDVNGDGLQSSSEAGILNVSVSLQVDRNGDGTYVTIATDVTDANGKYLFTDLAQGTYRVVLDRTANSSLIPNDAFGNDYLSSTGTTSGTLVYQTKTLPTSTSSDLTADFGFAPPASIGDTVYFDVNGNGTQDLTEDGINGVTVTLYMFTDADGDRRYDPGETLSAAVSSTVTATDPITGKTGFYQFDGLTPGYYVVQVTPLAGMTLTGDPNTDGFACQALNNPADPGEPSSIVCDHSDGMRLYNGTNYMGADFGYLQPGYVGDTVWIDTDGDGARDFDDVNSNSIQDLGEAFTEAGIPNITVTLTYCGADNNCATAADNTTTTTETDADGIYAFTGLAANGTFHIDLDTADVDWPAGLTPNSPSFEKNDATPDTQTDFVTTGGSLSSINGTACANCNLQVDFGYRYVGSTDIAGTVCLEVSSSDGQCDNINTADAAFQGITIYLYLLNDTNANGRYDAGETVTQVASVLTDASGNFSFTDLPDGEKYYIVALAAPQDALDLTTQEGSDTPAETTDLVEVVDPTGDTLSASQVIHVAAGDTSVTEVDFAFESNTNFDYGDLPDTYATTLEGTPDGPRHTVPAAPILYLGTTAPDYESNGVPSAGASSDDATVDDEDGVSTTGTWTNGDNGGTLQVVVTGSGYLTGWIDLNNDGDFEDGFDDGDGNYSEPGEWREFIVGQNVTSQTYSFPVDIPAGTFGAGNVTLNTRFRLFASQPPIPAFAYSGAASSGEVEDNSFTWFMTVDKDTSTANVTSNGTVSYTVALANTGSTSLTNVQATDTLPDFNGAAAGRGYTVTSVTATNGVSVNFPGFNGDTNTSLLAANVTLASGSSTVVTIQLTLSGATAGIYDNTAGAFSTQTGSMDDDGRAAGDPGTPSVGADPETDEDVTVSVPIDVSLDKQVFLTTPAVGSNVMFMLVVSNGGPGTATNVVVADVIPSGYTYVASSIAGGDTRSDLSPAGTGLTWTINNLLAGASVNLTYEVTVLGTGTYNNYAEISSHTETDSDSTPGNTTTIEDDDDTETVTPILLTATISDFVWNDLDGDGVQDGGLEVGMSNVRVYIDQNGDDNYDVGEPTASTNASGIYAITGLAAGTYAVRVDTSTLPGGYGQTYDLDGIATSNEASVTITAGQTRTDVDFGYQQQNAVISDFVWNDLDGDGVQDGGAEVGLDGVRVYIDQNGDDTYNAGEPTGITAGGGLYSIGNLAAGTYAVRVDTSTLPGYIQTYDLDGTGTSHEASVALTAGQTRADVDFGYRQPRVDVSLDKQVSNVTPSIGNVVTFTLVIANAGPNTATNVVVTDVVPNGYAYVSPSIAGGTTRSASSPAGTGLTWTINSLASGASVNLTYQATVLGTGTYDNYAEITSHTATDNDSIPNNGQQTPDEDDDDTVTVTPSSVSMNVDKTSSAGGTVNPDDQITYTINIENTLAIPMMDVVVTDAVPSGTTFDSGMVNGYRILNDYRDDFASATYNLSTGTQNWSTNAWTETGDDGLPGSGSITINGAGELYFNDPNGASIERTIGDLTGKTAVFLDIDVRETGGWDSTDSYTVDIWNGTAWQTVSTRTGQFYDPPTDTLIDISAYVNANTRIRIDTVNVGNGGQDENLYVNYIRIYYPEAANIALPHIPATVIQSADHFFLAANNGIAGSGADFMSITYVVNVDAVPSVSQIDNMVAVSSNEIPVQITDSTTDKLSQTGSLVIVKNSIPNDGQDFAYTVTGTGLTDFSLDDDADATLSNTRTFNGLAANGIYTVAETAATGWNITNISCTGATNSTVTIGAAGTFNPGDTNVSVQLAAGETVTCTFDNTAALSIVTAKTANDTSVPETGQSVIYTVQVQNTSPVSVTLNSLTDNIFNNITTTGHDNVTATTCATGGTIAAGGAYSCTFTATVSGSFPGTHVNTVTAQVSNGSSTASHSDNETITFEDVLPAITVTKTANPTSVPETGGSVTFTYQVQNTGTVLVTITNLGDDKFSISGDADCQVGTVLAAGASCDFTTAQTLSGAVGTSHTNVFTAQARDSQSNAASHTDNAVVTFTDTLGSISGTVFDDRSGDGNFDLAEPGISGVTVTLYQDTDGNGSYEKTVATYSTDALTGDYSFGNLPAGTYRVVETDPTGYSSTGDTNGANDNQINITLGVGNDSVNNDFFDWQPASIAGTVYDDVNGDGNLDAGEPGLSGVTVTLYRDTDGDGSYETTVGTYVTDLTTGDYSFGNLPAGSYRVVETDPAGYVSTGDTNAANDNIINVTLISGANSTDNDFFDIQQGTVDGTVYLDLNGNGSYEIGTDTPFNGVDVFITDSLGGTYTVQTNASGYFSQVVPAGATGVNVDNADLPAGVILTKGSTDPTTVTVPAGGTGTDNTGYVIPADISGTVYDDLNGDGNFDAGEPGLIGVTVELRNGMCTPGVDCPTTTTVGGDYGFTDLPPGNYTVVEADPTGYTSTGDTDGVNDNIIHVTLSGVNSTDNDFFDTNYADVSGTVYNDLNGDGNFDTGEPGLAGAQITLWKDTDNNGSYETQVGGSFTTLSGGAYSFSDLPAGSYQVREVDPGGYTSTGDTSGANDNIINVTLISGTDSSDNDFFDAQPQITVTKTANPASVPETGGIVTFTYQVQNTGTVPVTITLLTDDIFGVLAGDVDCQVNTVLAANASCDFTTSQTLSGAAGKTHTNVFTAEADDSSGNTATDDDDAVVTFTDVLPAVTVTKTASLTNVPETGASVTYTYQVRNTGAVPVTITGLSDDKFTITGDADCQVGTVLAAGTNCDFTSTQTLSGVAGTTHTNIFTAHVQDANLNNATDTDDEVVAFDSIFDPPTAIKTFNAAGLPELEFRMVWINSSNVAAIGVQVTDAIPLGTTYVAGSITCEERGSSSPVNVAVVPVPVSPLIAAAPEWSCGYDAVNNQVQWMGTIGPDNGNLTEAAAANEVVITFRVSVNASVNQVQNQGSARTDVDNDANFVEEMVLGTSLTSSNVVAWARTSVDPGQRVIATNTLPATGFAPNVVTDMSNVPLETYIAADAVTVEIPSLNVKIPVVGVPKKDGTWNVSWLGDQAGWLEGSAFPSWSGNSVLTGHVYLSNGLPGPFISLGRLKYGDKIIIHAYGQKYTFEVRTNQVVEPNDKSAMKHEEKAWLTLITCKEYDEKTNTYNKRIVVRAVLVNVTGE